jgi:murein DD-endopeptidase MepM/ murein hydrolase activator NlpD
MPRQATDLPGLEVNAQIHRADMSKADALSQLLGLANKTAQAAFSDVQEANNNADAAQALLDFGTNQKDDQRFAKSRAYRDAWQLQGAKKMAIDVSEEVTQKFNAALNDPDHPATLEDLDGIFEKTVAAHLQDPNGQPLDFITPQAKATLGTALMKLKSELMPKAAEAIKAQQDTKLYATTYHNMLFERDAGAPIGAPPRAKVDPLAPLPDTAAPAKPVSFGAPTGQLPIKGAITSSYADHIRRGSHGVDIDGTMGEPIQAPAGGKVTVGRDDRSGLFVKIDHGNGVVSSYAHLSGTNLQTGDVIQAGAILGKVGNSGHAVSANGGDGSHLHWRVKVNGKDVNPLTYAFKAGGEASPISDGSGPELATAAPGPTQLRPGFDVEGFMSSLPPSVDKGEAKKWIIQSLIADAASTGDSSLLNGLENLTRKDGTPSFTPEERLKLSETRDRIQERARIEADQKEQKLQKDNAETVLQAFVDGKPPSQSWLAEQSQKGLLSPNFVYSMVNHIEEEAKQEAREARMEARQTQAEADADTDAVVLGMVAQRRAGDLSEASYAEDLARFKSGALGSGKKAAARLLQLQAATKAGTAMIEQDPQFRYWSAKLKTDFKPRRLGDGIPSLLKPQSVVDEPTYQAMAATFEQKVHSGMKPDEAYQQAVKQYVHNAPKDAKSQLAQVRAQIEALQRKRAGQ